RLSLLWGAMEALLRDNGPAASGWVELAVEDGKEGAVRVVRLKGCRKVGTGWQVPALLMDAILQLDLLRPHWPNVVLTADVRAEAPHQRIRQAVDRSYSKRHLANPRNLRD